MSRVAALTRAMSQIDAISPETEKDTASSSASAGVGTEGSIDITDRETAARNRHAEMVGLVEGERGDFAENSTENLRLREQLIEQYNAASNLPESDVEDDRGFLQRFGEGLADIGLGFIPGASFFERRAQANREARINYADALLRLREQTALTMAGGEMLGQERVADVSEAAQLTAITELARIDRDEKFANSILSVGIPGIPDSEDMTVRQQQSLAPFANLFMTAGGSDSEDQDIPEAMTFNDRFVGGSEPFQTSMDNLIAAHKINNKDLSHFMFGTGDPLKALGGAEIGLPFIRDEIMSQSMSLMNALRPERFIRHPDGTINENFVEAYQAQVDLVMASIGGFKFISDDEIGNIISSIAAGDMETGRDLYNQLGTMEPHLRAQAQYNMDAYLFGPNSPLSPEDQEAYAASKQATIASLPDRVSAHLSELGESDFLSPATRAATMDNVGLVGPERTQFESGEIEYQFDSTVLQSEVYKDFISNYTNMVKALVSRNRKEGVDSILTGEELLASTYATRAQLVEMAASDLMAMMTNAEVGKEPFGVPPEQHTLLDERLLLHTADGMDYRNYVLWLNEQGGIDDMMDRIVYEEIARERVARTKISTVMERERELNSIEKETEELLGIGKFRRR